MSNNNERVLSRELEAELSGISTYLDSLRLFTLVNEANTDVCTLQSAIEGIIKGIDDHYTKLGNIAVKVDTVLKIS
jgi:capsule polysaccharide export protein KpsE/RkpR